MTDLKPAENEGGRGRKMIEGMRNLRGIKRRRRKPRTREPCELLSGREKRKGLQRRAGSISQNRRESTVPEPTS